MDTSVFILEIVIVLFFARCLGELASLVKIPAVIGEIVAGILLGPSLLGWVDLSPVLLLLSEIGIILLLFETGLQADIGRLSRQKGHSFLVAVAGVLLPLALGFFLSYSLFSLSFLTSLFIGGALTATSIGITLRILKELGQQKGEEAQIILGAAILDDILGMIVLAICYEFAVTGEVSLWNSVKVLIFAAIFCLLAPFVAKGIFSLIDRWEKKSAIPGLLPTSLVAVILFFAWVAHSLGVPELLGGFAAGLALSKGSSLSYLSFLRGKSEINERLKVQVEPIVHLFTPIFFSSIGLSLDLSILDWQQGSLWMLCASLTLVALAGKFAAGFCLIKRSWKDCLLIGIAMSPRGEMGLVFASIGLAAGVFPPEIYTSLILVLMLTTLSAPLLLRFFYGRRKKS